ncbi:hypothetical protein F4781DRAFT_428488 [Annulohypoxylon bovei var. microspora]|nr:hypothetical protein F4781DRAFT_428488 [Annulohypoxylon bovei var. microspora]
MAAAETKEAIRDCLLEDDRHWQELRDYVYDLNMPLLLNSDESPLPCRETPAEFEAINSSFSSQIHAFFEALRDFESLRKEEGKTEDVDRFIRKDGIIPAIRVNNQSFDSYPDCLHRNFHSPFADALKGMPALEEAELFTYLAWQPSEERRRAYKDSDEVPYNQDRAIYRWGVNYAPENYDGNGLLTWQVGSWRPQEDIIQSFKALGREGGEVEIIWKPFEFMDKRETEDRTAFSIVIYINLSQTIVKQNTYPELGSIPTKRGLGALGLTSNSSPALSLYGHSLEKRAAVWGPVLSVPFCKYFCPSSVNEDENSGTPCSMIKPAWDDVFLANGDGDSKVNSNPVYGFHRPDVCEDYEFGTPLNARVVTNPPTQYLRLKARTRVPVATTKTDEYVLLEHNINTPAKGKAWGGTTTTGKELQIIGTSKWMDKLNMCLGAGEIIKAMRYLIGSRMYHNDFYILQILKANPRKPAPYQPWQPWQPLTKTMKVINEFLPRLQEQWTDDASREAAVIDPDKDDADTQSAKQELQDLIDKIDAMDSILRALPAWTWPF